MSRLLGGGGLMDDQSRLPHSAIRVPKWYTFVIRKSQILTTMSLKLSQNKGKIVCLNIQNKGKLLHYTHIHITKDVK